MHDLYADLVDLSLATGLGSTREIAHNMEVRPSIC